MQSTDFLCVFGANGAGKTRLLRSIEQCLPDGGVGAWEHGSGGAWVHGSKTVSLRANIRAKQSHFPSFRKSALGAGLSGIQISARNQVKRRG